MSGLLRRRRPAAPAAPPAMTLAEAEAVMAAAHSTFRLPCGRRVSPAEVRQAIAVYEAARPAAPVAALNGRRAAVVNLFDVVSSSSGAVLVAGVPAAEADSTVDTFLRSGLAAHRRPVR